MRGKARPMARLAGSECASLGIALANASQVSRKGRVVIGAVLVVSLGTCQRTMRMEREEGRRKEEKKWEKKWVMKVQVPFVSLPLFCSAKGGNPPAGPNVLIGGGGEGGMQGNERSLRWAPVAPS